MTCYILCIGSYSVFGAQADVKQLKGFFEEVLDDHFWDAQKHMIMERAVKARPEYQSFDERYIT